MQQKPLAIISGGTSGIGLATARILAEEYRLALIYRSNAERALQVQAQLNSNNDVRIYQENLVDDISARHVYQRISKDFSVSPSVLVNAAGYSSMKLFLQSQHEDFLQTFQAHFLGMAALTRLVAEDMYARRFGRIITISSIATLANQKGLSAYASAKSAVEGFTKCIAVELIHRNVTVNCVQPGLTSASEEETIKMAKERGQAIVPVESVAQMIQYFCSPQAASVTGQVVLIDGNSSPQIPSV
jgi:NAD(P)-dependent dehydrogenase (short-subunit alcohol dehydrogenase family)